MKAAKQQVAPTLVGATPTATMADSDYGDSDYVRVHATTMRVTMQVRTLL